MPPRQRRTPSLPDELVEKVLTRLPPEDPASLVRAALVCRRWRRLVSDAGFRRRFRLFHRTPPMLGIIYSRAAEVSTFVRTSSSCPPIADRDNFYVMDVRHGRVLLHRSPRDMRGPWQKASVVWDPITDEQRELPLLPVSWNRSPAWNASVLCANHGRCDHLDCNRGPFLVVLVVTTHDHIHVYTYSSEAGTWSKPVTGQNLVHQHIGWDWQPNSALVGNSLYVKFRYRKSLLKFNLVTQGVSVIHLPISWHYGDTILMATEGDGLGVANVKNAKLYLWFGKASTDGGIRWARSRVIGFNTLLPDNAYEKFHVAGFAHGATIFVLRVNDDIFTFDLKSCKVSYICKDKGYVYDIFPFMSFYAPVLGESSMDDESKVVA